MTCGGDRVTPPKAYVVILSILNNDNQEAYSLSGLSMRGYTDVEYVRFLNP